MQISVLALKRAVSFNILSKVLEHGFNCIDGTCK
jgi:hypothetical protein